MNATRKLEYDTGLLIMLGSCVASATDAQVNCGELTTREGARLKDAPAFGSQLSAEQISRLMDNPVCEVVSVPLQSDQLSVTEPLGGCDLTVKATKLIPIFRVHVGDIWSLLGSTVEPDWGIRVSITPAPPSAFLNRRN